METTGRFYFSQGGQELGGHPLNGSVFEGCGAFVDAAKANRPGATPGDRARTSVTAFVGKRQVRTITLADFNTEQPVLVKLWFPNEDARDTFLLVRGL